MLTQCSLFATRRKRPIPEGWTSGDDISTFDVVASTEPLYPGSSAVSVNESGDLALFGGADGSARRVWARENMLMADVDKRIDEILPPGFPRELVLIVDDRDDVWPDDKEHVLRCSKFDFYDRGGAELSLSRPLSDDDRRLHVGLARAARKTAQTRERRAAILEAVDAGAVAWYEETTSHDDRHRAADKEWMCG